MLEALNKLSRDTTERTLCQNFPGGPSISLAQFQTDLSSLRAKIEPDQEDSWLLYCESPYYFLLGLMAILGLNKRVVICASAKPQWLEQLSGEFGAVLSDVELNVANKKCISFFSMDQNAPSWQPTFSGNEKIVFFTSGSTGQPKAIKKSLLALTNEIATLESTFKLADSPTVFWGSVSHLHIYGLLFKLLWPALTGNRWINQQVEYPEQLSPLVLLLAEECKQGAFISSPAFLSRLDLKLPALQLANTFSSGGPLSYAAASDAKAFFGNYPIEVYGSTETGGIAFRQQDAENTPWQPFPSIVLENAKGETRLSSPHIPDQAYVVLDDKLAFFPDGKFALKGRKDRIVKLEEKRISLTEIENYLEKLETIEQTVALLVKGNREVIGCAVVLSKAGEELFSRRGLRHLVAGWKDEMGQRFERITIPKKWRIVTEIPVNTQSKIDLESLRDKFESSV